MVMNLKIGLTIFMFLTFLNPKITNSYDVKENQNDIDFSIYYKEFSEIDGQKNVLNTTFKDFPSSESFGTKNGSYWFKLELEEYLPNNDIIAYVPTHNIDVIEVFKEVSNEVKYITSVGNSILRKDLKLDYQFPSFLIDKEQKGKTTYFLKVNFIKEANFPIKILKEKDFLNHIITKKTINSLYYGTCIVIILLNLFIFYKLRDKIYLFYALFLSSLMINFLLYDGSLINLFRGNYFYYNLELIIHITNELWFLLFSILFLNLHRRNPTVTKLFFIFPFLVIALYTCYLFNNNYTYVAFADVIGISLFPILWLYGIHYMKNMVYARFYVLGYLLLVPLSVFFIVGYPHGLWKVDGDMTIVKIASWLDIIVFTYAITYRTKVKLQEFNAEKLRLQHLEEEAKLASEASSPVNSYLLLLKENNLSNVPLTPREIDILKHLHEGDNNKVIGEKLFISTNTVKSHVRNIYHKMDVGNRAELKIKLTNSFLN